MRGFLTVCFENSLFDLRRMCLFDTWRWLSDDFFLLFLVDAGRCSRTLLMGRYGALVRYIDFCPT